MMEFLKLFYFKLFNKRVFKITNGFPNHNGKGPLLTGYLLSGEIEVGYFIVYDNDIRIPIIKIERSLKNPRNMALTIPREFENSTFLKLYKLYGRTLTIET